MKGLAWQHAHAHCHFADWDPLWAPPPALLLTIHRGGFPSDPENKPSSAKGILALRLNREDETMQPGDFRLVLFVGLTGRIRPSDMGTFAR